MTPLIALAVLYIVGFFVVGRYEAYRTALGNERIAGLEGRLYTSNELCAALHGRNCYRYGCDFPSDYSEVVCSAIAWPLLLGFRTVRFLLFHRIPKTPGVRRREVEDMRRERDKAIAELERTTGISGN